MKFKDFVVLGALAGVGIHIFLGERDPMVLAQFALYGAITGVMISAIRRTGEKTEALARKLKK